MIKLQYPVNLLKQYLSIVRVMNKEKKDEIMLENKLQYYEAKANIFSKRWEDSGRKDDKALIKSINSMIAYSSLNNHVF